MSDPQEAVWVAIDELLDVNSVRTIEARRGALRRAVDKFDRAAEDSLARIIRGMPEEQPLPVTTPRSEAVFPALLADIEARNAKGRLTYGRDLETFNGRDALRDAYEEALDLAVYLKQELMQREAAR